VPLRFSASRSCCAALEPEPEPGVPPLPSRSARTGCHRTSSQTEVRSVAAPRRASMTGRAATAPLRPRTAPPCRSHAASELARAEHLRSAKHQHRLPPCLLPSRGAHHRRSFCPDTAPVSLRLPCRFVMVLPGASPFATQFAASPPSGGS
jgi:hypothetical protein